MGESSAWDPGVLGSNPVLGKNFYPGGENGALWGDPKNTWDDIRNFFLMVLKGFLSNEPNIWVELLL